MVDNPYWDLNLEVVIPWAIAALLFLGLPLWLMTKGMSRRSKRILRGVVLPSLLVLNPCSGWIFLEPLNKHLLTKMKEQAESIGLEGKTYNEVHALFGEPTFVWESNEEITITWNYQRPAWYVFGSKFQVHFQRGVVHGWEAYDD